MVLTEHNNTYFTSHATEFYEESDNKNENKIVASRNQMFQEKKAKIILQVFVWALHFIFLISFCLFLVRPLAVHSSKLIS
jgi:ATP-dependent Zn protease